LPEGEADFATRWRLIKSTFSRALPKGERISPSRLRKGERGIWQRRYWEHTLRENKIFAACGLHSFQSGEARAGDASYGLATFIFS
jgi:REP element-mobilizing transposase RayT